MPNLRVHVHECVICSENMQMITLFAVFINYSVFLAPKMGKFTVKIFQ